MYVNILVIGGYRTNVTTVTKGEETRSRILGSAAGLINRKGLKHTSIRDIIDATGVKKGQSLFSF